MVGHLPGGPEVTTLHFQCRGMGSIPGWGTKIPHATWRGQKQKKSELHNYFQHKSLGYTLQAMIFEGSVNCIFGCIIFCDAEVTTSTQELRAERTPSELQLRVTCSSGASAESREPSQLPPSAALSGHSHGETGVELAAGPRSQVEPRAHLCPSQDPLQGPGAGRAPRPTCAFSPCAAVLAWG